MTVSLYRNDRVEVIEDLGSLVRIRTENGAEFWVRPKQLKPLKQPKVKQERNEPRKETTEGV